MNSNNNYIKAWEMDDRHVDWVRRIASGYKRVLEIGSFYGHSSKALFNCEEVHLCDTLPSDHLRSLVADRANITLHQCPSVELLAVDADFDLIVVDGNHNENVVLAEIPLLLASARLRMIFAHDTANARCPGVGGPQYLKQAFQVNGWYCLEDSILRKDELTERGLFFAARSLDDYAIGLEAYRAII